MAGFISHKIPRIFKVLTAILLSLSLITAVGAAALHLLSYDAEDEAVEAFCDSLSYERREEDGYIAFLAEDAESGVIFYPGGLVDEDAYIPLLCALANDGISAFLVPMPFDLAVFNMNAADGIREANPDISDWYIGGHSLGGAMASSYLAENTENFKGLILLASYSTEDLSEANVKALSVYGSNDGVLNAEKYEECKQNLPKIMHERIIEGGNHAGFGMYGEQKNDCETTLENGEQILITVDLISNFVNE